MGYDTMTSGKIEPLLHYVKAYEIRDPSTLGVVFCLFNEGEIIEKGVYINDLTLITEEPLLHIGYDKARAPTKLTYKGLEYKIDEEILNVLRPLDRYFVNIKFPGGSTPGWYLKNCEPNPYSKAISPINRMVREIHEQSVCREEFKALSKEVLMILLDHTLDSGDKKHFYTLTKEWKGIDNFKNFS